MEKKVSRREFLKGLAVFTASLAVGVEGLEMALETPPPPPPPIYKRMYRACADYVILDPIEQLVWDWFCFDNKLRKIIFLGKLIEKTKLKLKQLKNKLFA